MTTRRPPLPKDIETEVLIRSRRRCCLCVFIKGDLTSKRIQIAHIDRNASNNKLDNLVALCQEHHDDYDSQRSQTKGLTASEIKHYRAQLDKIIQRQDEQLVLPVAQTDPNYENGISTHLARLIGQVLILTDEEMFRLQNGRRATGIPLLRLGIKAVEEEGDFDTANEAFMSLLHIAFASKTKFNGGSGLQTENIATPHIAALKLLLRFALNDIQLFNRAVDTALRFALIGNNNIDAAADYTLIPNEEFYTIIEVLSKAAHRLIESQKWASLHIASSLSRVLLGIGYVLREQSIPLPSPPSARYLLPDGTRIVEPGGRKEVLPIVRLCGYLGEFPQEAYEHAMATLHYNFSVRGVQKVTEQTASVYLYSVDRTITLLKAWAVMPNQLVVAIQACTDKDIELYESMIKRATARGTGVAILVREYLESERGLFMKKNPLYSAESE
jgi:hypothetical protein